MLKLQSIFYCLTLMVFLSSCGDNNETPSTNTGDPTDLVVEWNISEDVDGKLDVQASANNVDFFEFAAGDGSDLVTNSSGNFSITYEATGTYEAVVRAYGTSGRFLEERRSIPVLIGGDEITTYSGFELIWNDEFNDSAINTSNWNFEIGNGCPGLCGWGNNESQYYTMENTAITGGNMVITATEQTIGNNAYTSSRLTTKDKFEFEFGRVDIRAQLPKGQGIWPALWMLGANIDQVGWPRCGEIDIMEMVGGDANGRDNTTHGTIHYDDNGHTFFGEGRSLSSGIFNDNFHLFSIIWNETEITWLLDDEPYFTADIRSPEMSELRNDFFLIFNIAVGGNWPGEPDANTSFPQEMKVDFIRVYQEL